MESVFSPKTGGKSVKKRHRELVLNFPFPPSRLGYLGGGGEVGKDDNNKITVHGIKSLSRVPRVVNSYGHLTALSCLARNVTRGEDSPSVFRALENESLAA